MTGPHRLVNPAGLAAPAGFSHAVVAAPGRTVHVAGQIGVGTEAGGFAQQFGGALANVAVALEAAGARPEQVVSLVIYTTDMDGYRSSLPEVGRAYRAHFGRHFPAMALIGVTALVDPRATVEIMATAVIPE